MPTWWPGPEVVTFVAMLASFGVLAVWRRWPIGVSLALAAWVGGAINGDWFPLRHLVEGAFAYLDPILVIATAMIFMRALVDGGALPAVGAAVERRFRDRPVLLLPLLMLVVMFPGMITGSSTASVLTTGAMAAPILCSLGLAPARAAAIVAMGGVLGMVAPPINIPAMLIGTGIDLPYVGFGAPLAAISFPVALGVAYGLGWPLLRRAEPRAHRRAPDGDSLPLWRALAPVLVAATLMGAPRFWPTLVPDPGLPLVFMVSATAGVLAGARFPLGGSLVRAVEESLPVLGILTGVGAFIQVMTLTGARGWLVDLLLGAPSWAIYAAAAVGIPLFGAVSAFGSASVLGVPFLLALLGRNEVVTTSALSMLASLGDLMLPAAIAATLAARVAGVDDRMKVLRLLLVPAFVTLVVAVGVLVFAPQIGWIL